MRYMVIVKNDPQTEGMEMPPEAMTEMFASMGRYNEQLAEAGVMLAGEGLLPAAGHANLVGCPSPGQLATA